MNDNEIIALFMGFTYVETEHDKLWNPPNLPPATITRWCHHSNGLDAFRTSWDWLMPVVEKISRHIYESWEDSNGYKNVTHYERAYPRTFGMIDNDGKWMVRINRMPLEQEDTLIKATYNSIVEFIKRYNELTIKP